MQDGFLETSNTSWPGTPLYWISTAFTLAEYIEILHTNSRHSKFEVCEVPYFYINYYLRNKKVVHYLLAITTHYTFFLHHMVLRVWKHSTANISEYVMASVKWREDIYVCWFFPPICKWNSQKAYSWDQYSQYFMWDSEHETITAVIIWSLIISFWNAPTMIDIWVQLIHIVGLDSWYCILTVLVISKLSMIVKYVCYVNVLLNTFFLPHCTFIPHCHLYSKAKICWLHYACLFL